MSGNTIMTAKNSFQEGLIMDFSPDNTNANCMTSALNATLLTFNGNEMQLQNDMGNGRVETAYLPDGYVPVGTCEFGDIVYIVSYNPLIDKALIGCFPSPERNISSEELHMPKVTLKSEDFQEIENGSPTGNLKASSAKYVLFNNNLHPGDKYIIASQELQNSKNTISAYGSTKYDFNDFPKFVKIHVVSIEDSGKITYLDSSVKWYNDSNITNGNTPYYISSKVSDSGSDKKIDIDDYRSLVSSGYSVFKSKTSGQLALLVELEKITGFSCSWECFKKSETEPEESFGIKYTNYDVFLNFSWNTNHPDINPSHIIIEGLWLNKTNNNKVEYKSWKFNEKNLLILDENKEYNCEDYNPEIDLTRHYQPENVSDYSDYEPVLYNTIVSNYIDGSITRLMNYDSKLKLTYPDVSNKDGYLLYILNCNTAEISSNEVGNEVEYKLVYKDIDLKDITPIGIPDSVVNNKYKYPITKYFQSFSIPTHTKIEKTINIDGNNKTLIVYNKNNISNLVFKYRAIPAMPYGKLEEFAQEGFIDFSKIGLNHIELTTWKYYNYESTTTLNWGFDAYTDPNQIITNVTFSFYDDAGLVAKMEHPNYSSYNGSFTDYIILNRLYGNGNIQDGDLEHKNSGTLLSNMLYLVKIDISKGTVLTNNTYVDAGVETVYRWFWTNRVFNSNYLYTKDFDTLKITLGLNSNIKFSLTENWLCELSDINGVGDENIGTHNLHKSLSAKVQKVGHSDDKLPNVKGDISITLEDNFGVFQLDSNNKYDLTIYEGNESITNVPENPNTKFSHLQMSEFPYINPLNAVGKDFALPKVNLNEDGNSYKEYYNTSALTLKGRENIEEKLEYVSNNKLFTINNPYSITKIIQQNQQNSFDLDFKTTHYSKYYYYTGTKLSNLPVIKPVLYTSEDLGKYNLCFHEINEGNKKIVYFNIFAFASCFKVNDDKYDDMAVLGGLFTLKKDGSSSNGFPIRVNEQNVWTGLSDKGQGNGHSFNMYDDAVGHIKYRTNHGGRYCFIVPFLIGVDMDVLSGGKRYSKYYEGFLASSLYNGEYWFNPHTRVLRCTSWSSNYDVVDHYTLALVTPSNDFRVLSNWKGINADNRKTRHIDIVLSLLTQIYYKSSLTEELVAYYKSNYGYLQDNYTLYSKDIVVYTKPEEGSDFNVVFKDMTLLLYSQYVIRKCLKPEEYDQKVNLILTFNILLVIKNQLKVYPIQFRMDYIKPTIEFNAANSGSSLVKSLDETMPTLVNLELEINKPYVYDKSTNSFVLLGSQKTLPHYSDIVLEEDNLGMLKLVSRELIENKVIALDGLQKCFSIKDNRLYIDYLPEVYAGTYNILIGRTWEGKYVDDVHLKGFHNTHILQIEELQTTQ